MLSEPHRLTHGFGCAHWASEPSDCEAHTHTHTVCSNLRTRTHAPIAHTSSGTVGEVPAVGLPAPAPAQAQLTDMPNASPPGEHPHAFWNLAQESSCLWNLSLHHAQVDLPTGFFMLPCSWPFSTSSVYARLFVPMSVLTQKVFLTLTMRVLPYMFPVPSTWPWGKLNKKSSGLNK